MTDIAYALLILLGLRHSAPAIYHAPIKTIPLVIYGHSPIQSEQWGPLS